MEQESDGDTNCSWYPWTVFKGLEKKHEELKESRQSWSLLCLNQIENFGEFWRKLETCCYLDFCEKNLQNVVKTGGKTSQGVKW